MLKRPMEDDTQVVENKKARTDSLDELKMNLEALLKEASEHHEEVRIQAVDSAYDLEESLKDAMSTKDSYSEEHSQLTQKYEKAKTYLDTFENSPSVKMLQKASSSDMTGLEKLSQDHQKITEALNHLRKVLETTSTQLDACKVKLENQEKICERLKTDHETAEARAEQISRLNEN